MSLSGSANAPNFAQNLHPPTFQRRSRITEQHRPPGRISQGLNKRGLCSCQPVSDVFPWGRAGGQAEDWSPEGGRIVPLSTGTLMKCQTLSRITVECDRS